MPLTKDAYAKFHYIPFSWLHNQFYSSSVFNGFYTIVCFNNPIRYGLLSVNTYLLAIIGCVQHFIANYYYLNMEFIQRAALFIVTQRCYDEYFIKFNLLDVSCFKATLSKCLGIGLILGSLLVKLPQILKIYNNKSGEGISLLSVTLDLSAITIYAAYSYVKEFPFTAWGDSAFLAVQTVTVGALILHYNKKPAQVLCYLLGYLVICFVLMGGSTPVEVLWTMQGFNIPVLLTGKLMQAVTNYKNGHTGQLSAVTLFMLFFGSLARIFTSIQETGDRMVIVTYVASSFANTVIVLQLLYYWNVDVSQKDKLKKVK